ncbi:MAG TPA: hypothetical protein VKN99_25270 [Polyangia bacterium]|nr:hypothetical protein [Polyangia bacterium]
MRWHALILLASLLPGCRGCARAGFGRGEVPADLRIEVDVDGREVAPIDANILAAHPPDFHEGGRRAWRLAGLLGALYARPGSVLEVEDADGVKTTFLRPAEKIEGREPVLMLNQRGEVLVALMNPDEPWPGFHGRGGNRGRPGDPSQRVRGVRRLRLYVAQGAEPAPPSTPGFSIAVIVDGKPPLTWTRADLARVGKLAVSGDSGEGSREGWSLREVARALVDAKASVVSLRGEGGRELAIDPSQWRDPTRLPVLRLNRRGQLKFQWTGKDGHEVLGEGLRGVSEIVIRH